MLTIDTMGVMSLAALVLSLAAAHSIVEAASSLKICCCAKPTSRVFRR